MELVRHPFFHVDGCIILVIGSSGLVLQTFDLVGILAGVQTPDLLLSVLADVGYAGAIGLQLILPILDLDEAVMLGSGRIGGRFLVHLGDARERRRNGGAAT